MSDTPCRFVGCDERREQPALLCEAHNAALKRYMAAVTLPPEEKP